MNTGRVWGAAADTIAEMRQDHPAVVRLAEGLCLAAHAEPDLVRGARLEFVPASSAGLEALLWFSPLVEAADSRALILDPAVATQLRRELAARDPALLRRVRAFTEAHHRHAPPAVLAFERLLWAATVERVLPEEAVRRELEPFEKALVQENGTADEVGRWVLHFLPRLPSSVRQSSSAWRLHVAAAEKLGIDLPEHLAADRGPEDLLAARALVRGKVAVGVRLCADGAVLSRPPALDAQVCVVAGAARVRLAVRGALPGAVAWELDLYDRQQAAVRMDVVAGLRPDGAVEWARVEMDSSVLFAHGGRRDVRAVSVSSDDSTVLRLEGGAQAVEVAFEGTPTRLAVTYDGAAAVAAVGSRLHLVRTGQGGAPEARVRDLPRGPAALGWLSTSRGPLLCAALGREVVLYEDDDPGAPVAVLDHRAEVVRLWCGAPGDRLATADAQGYVSIWRRQEGGAVLLEHVQEPGGRVTALAGDPRSGSVVWGLEDGSVRMWQPAGHTEGATPGGGGSRILGTLPRAATGLAVPDGAQSVLAADGGRRLRQLVPDPRSAAVRPSGEPAASLVAPGGPAERRLPLRVREVHPAGDGSLLLVGSGGPLEIRSEDGRTHVAALAPSSPSTGANEPGWLRDAIGAHVAAEALAAAEAAALLRTARGAGVSFLLLDGAWPAGSDLLPQLCEQARAAGLRLVADLHPPRAPERGGGADSTSAARALVLETAHDLLEHTDGLRLRDAATWQRGLVGDLSHLVDAYPEAVLLARLDGPADEQSTARLSAHCHLVVTPAADPRAAPGPLAAGTGWALPASPGRRRSAVRDALLLSLPGCREVPSDLLADGTEERWLRGLLAARTHQPALLHGAAETVDSGSPDVVALRRRYKDEEVLCLTNTADRAAIARSRSRPGEAALVEIVSDSAHDQVTPSVLRTGTELYDVPVRPGHARWFRVLDAAQAPLYGVGTR